MEPLYFLYFFLVSRDVRLALPVGHFAAGRAFRPVWVSLRARVLVLVPVSRSLQGQAVSHGLWAVCVPLPVLVRRGS